MEIIFLTCPNKKAKEISFLLLTKRLVACVKNIEVQSSFRWKGEIEEEKEALLLMETKKENFSQIEEEVRKIHPDEVFVLASLPAQNVSKGVEKWLTEELKNQ